jgi:hypothetical protein
MMRMHAAVQRQSRRPQAVRIAPAFQRNFIDDAMFIAATPPYLRLL